MGIGFSADYGEDNKIINFINRKLLEDTPEERVRQKFLKILHYEYGYPKKQMSTEVPIFHGNKETKGIGGKPVRADIVVYENNLACANRDQGRIVLIVECKAPDRKTGYNQLVSYICNTNSGGGIWFNGSGDDSETECYRRTDTTGSLVPWPGFPRRGESWDSIGRRKKSELLKPKDVKGLLRKCHNRLHGRGTEEDDLTMDMVRFILAKACDEEQTGEQPEFYCTPEEYADERRWGDVETRIQGLFAEVKKLNSGVFEPHERIQVGARAICDVVSVLQDYRLLSDLSDNTEWDLMGHAYEEYTATYLKRRSGQFFTNRLVVDFLVRAVDPDYDDMVLDPAGGSGGFLTGVLRHVRNKIILGEGTKISKQRRLDTLRTRLFMVESSKRLVKVAKTAMILNGDGHTGMTQGDALGQYSDFDTTILAQCGKGRPTVIFTNPPFAGTGEGRITDAATLSGFALGKKQTTVNGSPMPTDEIASDGVPPEMLFFERCVDWLAPGGYLGIVLPKGFLDTNTYLAARHYLFANCRLLAVVNLHKNTFQPHTGVRTCLVIVRKKDGTASEGNYPVFMAVSKSIGQDSEGRPIFRRDSGTGDMTDEPDSDLGEILSNFLSFKNDALVESEYCFSGPRSSIDGQCRINPQAYMPSLNKTLRDVARMDDLPGWSVSALGQISADIRIFQGPRWKSENIVVENGASEGICPYYTPSAILQERNDSRKYFDLSRASKKQLKTIEKLRVRRGDILITRSGSVGRVIMVTGQLDGAIASDDLIRVIIPDENLRHYVYCFLTGKQAQDQLSRNEYGSIQQHLESVHVSNLLIPIPDDARIIEDTAKQSVLAVRMREESSLAFADACRGLQDMVSSVIGSRSPLD
jgi:type I restriction-modification system DNA methylase subunit